MQYLPDDTGPFYLDDAKKQELKFDYEMNKTEKKKYSRVQLIDMIKEKLNIPNVRGTLKEVQGLTLQYDIPIEYE